MPRVKTICPAAEASPRRRAGRAPTGAAARWPLLPLLCVPAGAALAHGGALNDVYARRGPLPGLLKGVRVQVRQSLAPEVLVATGNGKTVTVLDRDGRAFLRIGPRGVFADRDAPAWFRSRTPLRGVPLPPGVSESAAPHWVRISRGHAWGWFDPRVATSRVHVPEAVEHAHHVSRVGSWSIPVRVGGTRSAIRGSFRYHPPPRGAFEEQLTSPWDPAPGVRVSLSVARIPAISVRNTGDKVVTVIGASGQPFLRLSAHGVYANVASRSWRDSARHADRVAPVGGGRHWVKVSTGGRYTWVEPRAGYLRAAAPTAAGTAPVPLRHWRIPIRIGNRQQTLRGVTYWQPLPGD